MKALVLFRSYHGNTKQVAEGIAKELGSQGIETIVQDLRRKLPDLSDIDFILIGSPTRMARVNRKALRVLERLQKKGFREKPVAIFDTYGPIPKKPEEIEKAKKWLYPGAAGIMQKVAKTLGLNVYSENLRCEVRGMKGPLADNELEKAAFFTKEFLSMRSPRR
jgi:flavodoxin